MVTAYRANDLQTRHTISWISQWKGTVYHMIIRARVNSFSGMSTQADASLKIVTLYPNTIATATVESTLSLKFWSRLGSATRAMYSRGVSECSQIILRSVRAEDEKIPCRRDSPWVSAGTYLKEHPRTRSFLN